MCAKSWMIGSLVVGHLIIGLVSSAAGQGNPTYMNHFVGRAMRHAAYERARLQAMQIRLEQERVRSELARVKRQQKLERTPGVYTAAPAPLRKVNPTAPIGEPTETASTFVEFIGLNSQTVDAVRRHYDAVREIHDIRREHLVWRDSPKRATRPSPSQFDRVSGRALWPALLTDSSQFRDDVRKVDKLLAQWAQCGHDPTSLAAVQARKTVKRMSHDLLMMLGDGDIDKRAYEVTRDFLASIAYETEFFGTEQSENVARTFASTR